MLEELIKFYKTDLNVIGIVKKYSCRKYYLLNIIAILVLLLVIYFFMQILLDYPKLSFLGLSVVGVVIIFLYRYFSHRLINSSLKKMNDPNVKTKGSKDWDNDALNRYFREKISEKLKEKAIENRKEELIKQLEKKAEADKVPFYIFCSAFSALALIVFNSLCESTYTLFTDTPFYANYTGTTTMTTTMTTTITGTISNTNSIIRSDLINNISAITIFFIVLVLMIAYCIRSINELYFILLSDYQSTKSLIKLLEEEKLKE